MQERVLKSTPGVLVGMSTTEAYRATAIFYDGNKQILEVDLSHPMPPVKTEITEPGLDINLFCEDSIRVRYPKNAEIDIQVV